MFRPANCITLLLFLFFIVSCHHQARTEKEEATFWKTHLIDTSYQLLYQDRDTTAALQYFDKALGQFDRDAAYPRAARYDLLANYHYFFSGDNKATANMIDSALAMYPTTELQNQYPRTYVGLLLFGGQIAYRLSRYSKANDYFFRAQKLATAHLDPCERTSFHYNIAMVLFRQENFNQAKLYFAEAFALQATCLPQTTAILLQQQEIKSNIGLCHLQLRNSDSAALYFDQALQLAEQHKDSLGPIFMDKIAGVVYGHQAQVAMARGHLEEARKLSLKSIALNDRKGYEMEHALGIKLQLAEVYSRQKDLSSMYGVLHPLRHHIGQAKPRHRWEWRRLMASYSEKTSQTDSALHYLKGYYALQDSIADEQKQLTDADIARQLQTKEQELQIAVLKKDQHITQISLWVTIIFSCLVMLIVYLVYSIYRRSKKSLLQSLALNKEIRRHKEAREQEAKQRHKLITEAVIQAQESERSIIGLELHDNVGQVLTTVKLHNEMLLEGVGDPKIILPRSVTYLQNCITEIRSLSKRLSAPTLGNISLEESVNDLIESINITSKVKITRQISGLGNERLRQNLHLGVYRILQEQLNNVLKHAEASEVEVQLERKNNTLRLCITDNGKGFTISRSKNGIGLMNMQTRAENLNGIFKVASRPGEGCRVEVVVPFVE